MGQRWLVICDPVLGLSVRIKKAISKMKSGKVARLSGIVVEMLKASGETRIEFVTELANSIANYGVVRADWEVIFIVNSYKRKGDALGRGNYRGLKLSEHLKVVERIVERLVKEKVKIDMMLFRFMAPLMQDF